MTNVVVCVFTLSGPVSVVTAESMLRYPAMDPIVAAKLEARDEREYSKRMLAAIELGREADAAFEQWLREADATWLAARERQGK